MACTFASIAYIPAEPGVNRQQLLQGAGKVRDTASGLCFVVFFWLRFLHTKKFWTIPNFRLKWSSRGLVNKEDKDQSQADFYVFSSKHFIIHWQNQTDMQLLSTWEINFLMYVRVTRMHLRSRTSWERESTPKCDCPKGCGPSDSPRKLHKARRNCSCKLADLSKAP